MKTNKSHDHDHCTAPFSPLFTCFSVPLQLDCHLPRCKRIKFCGCLGLRDNVFRSFPCQNIIIFTDTAGWIGQQDAVSIAYVFRSFPTQKTIIFTHTAGRIGQQDAISIADVVMIHTPAEGNVGVRVISSRICRNACLN